MLSRTTMAGLVAVMAGATAQVSAEGVPEGCRVELAFPATCATQGPAGTPFATGANCRTVDIDGFPRQYIVYVPASAGTQPPVVFMHHGSGGDGLKFLHISGWTEKADEVGLVAVYPTALEAFVLEEQRCSTKWNAYGLESEIDLAVKPFLVQPNQGILAYPETAPWPADDVAFERAMVDELRTGLDVDPERLYVSGFSNGAGFTARLAIEMADVFAAAAWSGGALGDAAGSGPPIPARLIPVVMQAGSCDLKVADNLGLQFDQDHCARGLVKGMPLDPGRLLAIPQFVALVHDHLDAFLLAFEPFETVPRDQSTCLRWDTPSGAGPAAVYQFAMLAGVTHQYPTCNPNRCNNPHRFSAANRFWQFFSGDTECR